jgi:hypothetical protein
MLQDYTSREGQRYELMWEGFVFLGVVRADGLVYGLHDQDFIHNGKKLINLLDSPVQILQFGRDVCCLEHVEQMYNKYNFDQYGL